MRVSWVIGATLSLSACDNSSPNLISCEDRFPFIINGDRPPSDDIYVYDFTFIYDVTNAPENVVEEILDQNAGSSLTISESKRLVNIVRPKIAREDAIKTGCAMEQDGVSLSRISYGNAAARPNG